MISQPYLVLCKRTINGVPYDEGWDPSIVIHEYTHGVTQFTADFAYEFESGALSESFSDIFGVGIQALKLDNGNTDWILGNNIPRPIDLTRHLDFPKLAGNHWTGQFSSGNPVYAVGQPDTYLGENYCENCPLTVDNGGVHINSGIQNKWFYLLANGGSGTNDNDESYNIQGIGIEKALKIAYYNLTGVLMEASQFTDARQGSIWESINLFGECSIEHQSTVNAWHAVGIGDVHNCQFTLSNPESENEFEMTLYPNPASNLVTLRSSHRIEDVIQIVDINGRVLDEFYSSELMFPINISKLTNGVYFIKTNTIFGIKTLKFVINY